MTNDAPERIWIKASAFRGERKVVGSSWMDKPSTYYDLEYIEAAQLAARDATIAEQAREIEALNAEIARLHRPRCELHGELADDGLCDVCEGRGLWEGV